MSFAMISPSYKSGVGVEGGRSSLSETALNIPAVGATGEGWLDHVFGAQQSFLAARALPDGVESSQFVMAGLDPAIHAKRSVDPRVKPGDDEFDKGFPLKAIRL